MQRGEFNLPKDLIFLAANSQDGKDYAVGDIHGNLNSLNAVFAKLKPQDRLFICGDLVDKGEQSIDVIKAIMSRMNQVYVVRGNHEDMVLQSLSELEKIFPSFDRHGSPEELEKLAQYLEQNPIITNHFNENNGGKWLGDLFLRELLAGKAYFNRGQINYTADSDIRQMKSFFRRLPYIMHVQGSANRIPFNIVHADLPLNDSALQNRLRKQNFALDDFLKQYTTWARENSEAVPFENFYRDKKSTLAFGGHTITALQPELSLREDTKFVNLDTGSYLFGPLLLVNITDMQAELCGPLLEPDAEAMPDYHRLLERVNTYLTSCKKEFDTLLRPLATANSIEDMLKVIDANVSAYPYYDIVAFMLNHAALTKYGINTLDDFELARIDFLAEDLKFCANLDECNRLMSEWGEDWPEYDPPENLLERCIAKGHFARFNISTVSQFAAELAKIEASLPSIPDPTPEALVAPMPKRRDPGSFIKMFSEIEEQEGSLLPSAKKEEEKPAEPKTKPP